MRIAVTGASGFVGGAVVADAVARGHEVLALSRRPAVCDGVTWRHWDVTSGRLAQAPEVDVVVHAAARVGEHGRSSDFARANVAGTAAVLESFPGARLVHVSSASVYDPFVPTVQGREGEAPVWRYLGRYAASKAAAERYLLARAHRAGGGVVILRPHAVYGPGDTTLLPRIESAVRGRRLVIAGDGRTLQSLTHIENLLAAVRAAAQLDVRELVVPRFGTDPFGTDPPGTDPSGTDPRGTDPPGTDALGAGPAAIVANVADAHPVVLRDVLLELLARRGRPDVEVIGVPLPVASTLARVAELAAWLDPRGPGTPPREPRLSRYAISHLALERTLDLSVLRHRLGVDPAPTDLTGAEHW